MRYLVLAPITLWLAVQLGCSGESTSSKPTPGEAGDREAIGEPVGAATPAAVAADPAVAAQTAAADAAVAAATQAAAAAAEAATKAGDDPAAAAAAAAQVAAAEALAAQAAAAKAAADAAAKLATTGAAVTPPAVTPAANPAATPAANAAPAAIPAAAAPAATVADTPAAPARGPTTYALDPGSSWLYAVLKYDRNTLIKGHDHVVRASTFDGSVVWSPSDAGACKVQISFPANALVIDPPGARSRAGLDGETNEGDLPKIKENMLSKTQINASVFPTISFTSTSCSGTSGSVKVSGNLSIHGVAKPVTATLTITEDGSSFAAKGSFSITHRMFGFDPFVAALGALKNDDNLKIVVDVKGKAR
jgi:polyisoprenoid-binding protein YceI